MEDTVTADNVLGLTSILDDVATQIDRLGMKVAAASPYGVIVGTLRLQFEALEKASLDFHTHLAIREANNPA